jgi:hypothetical protein
MQWKPSKTGAKVVIPLEAQLTKNQLLMVCFAHGGFAVAGAVGEACVHVWDAERGDELLSLNHGGKLSIKYKRCNNHNTKKFHRGFESTCSCGALNRSMLVKANFAD